MGAAINLALDKVDERKRTYKQNKIRYYQPIILLISAGKPTDDSDTWKKVCERIHNQEALGQVKFFALGVEAANMGKLKEFSEQEPRQLREILIFREMIFWGTAFDLPHFADRPPVQGPVGWGPI